MLSRPMNGERLSADTGLDRLTGVMHRDPFIAATAKAIARVADHGRMLTVLALDLRHFNALNLDYGFQVADDVLSAAAARLQDTLPAPATIGRMGGDEFLVLLENLPDQMTSDRLMDRIRAAFSAPLETRNLTVQISVTLGAAHYPQTMGTPERLVVCAHEALHRAKEHALNFWRYEDGVLSRTDHAASEEIRAALRENRFELYYQPRLCLRTRRLVSLEALIRWHHPERGIVMPNDFIQAAESSGMIVPLGYWIIDQACRDLAVLAAHDMGDVMVATNLSFRQLQDDRFCDLLPRLVRRRHVTPENLEFELTETAVLTDPARAMTALESVHALGVHLSLDDFGTGYSALTHIQQFPINTIKIDRSFTKRITSDAEAGTIVRSIIHLAHELGLQVVAEGVETLAQLACLRAEGCDQVQGFLFSQPRPLWEIMQLVDHTLVPLQSESVLATARQKVS